MGQFNRRKFLVTGAAVLGASGIVAGIGWWYRAQRMPSTAIETGAQTAGEFPNALRLRQARMGHDQRRTAQSRAAADGNVEG